MTSKLGYEKKKFFLPVFSFQFRSDKINYLAFGKVRSRMYTHSHRALSVGNDVLISNSRADDDDNEITHEKKSTVCLVVISCTSRVSTAARKKISFCLFKLSFVLNSFFFQPKWEHRVHCAKKCITNKSLRTQSVFCSRLKFSFVVLCAHKLSPKIPP